MSSNSGSLLTFTRLPTQGLTVTSLPVFCGPVLSTLHSAHSGISFHVTNEERCQNRHTPRVMRGTAVCALETGIVYRNILVTRSLFENACSPKPALGYLVRPACVNRLYICSLNCLPFTPLYSLIVTQERKMYRGKCTEHKREPNSRHGRWRGDYFSRGLK